ncbi:MAG: PAS domain S-box protein [Desulfarculaceae bacterium]|nr:PAS domain S-box protein [Desulfarculaceae bacterium]
MNIQLDGLNIAVIGADKHCEKLLSILLSESYLSKNVRVLAVADRSAGAGCLEYARKKGVFTTTDLKSVYQMDNLDLVVHFSKNGDFRFSSDPSVPERVRVLDHYDSMVLLDHLEIESEKNAAKQRLLSHDPNGKNLDSVFDEFAGRITRIIEDRTEHLHDKEKGLSESEKELSQIIQGSMIPTFIINEDHIVTHWNRACEKLTDSPAYTIVGTDKQWTPFRSEKRPTMADVVLGGMDEDQVTKYYGNLWQKSEVIEEAYEAEEFFPHLGENGKWIYFTAAPIKSPEGKVIGAIETLWDKTETKKVEKERELKNKEVATLFEKCRNSEEKYRSLFNNNPTPIFIIDSQTFEILDVNNRVEENYGYSRDELIGTSFPDLGDREDETIANGLQKIRRDKSVLFSKKRHYKKGKKVIFVNINVCYAQYSLRDVLIASATDITESIEKETQLIQAGKMATLGTMAAGMAHEINQPLNVIQICADYFLKMTKKGQTMSTEDMETLAKDIIDNVERAAGVIKHVRDFARQSERDLKKIVINDPVNDVFKVLGHQLSVHNIEVELDLDPDIPQIRAEHNRLEQVFINLVTNAIDSMDEKEARAESRSVEKKLKISSFAKEGYACVTVSDTGVGMTEDVREKIFEPFYTTKETGKGTGLGTSISYGIINDYGGTIDVKSEPDKGAVFTIQFPIIS